MKAEQRTKEQRIVQLEKLLREAVKIVHCHARNTDKDWLSRARSALAGSPPETEKDHG